MMRGAGARRRKTEGSHQGHRPSLLLLLLHISMRIQKEIYNGHFPPLSFFLSFFRVINNLDGWNRVAPVTCCAGPRCWGCIIESYRARLLSTRPSKTEQQKPPPGLRVIPRQSIRHLSFIYTTTAETLLDSGQKPIEKKRKRTLPVWQPVTHSQTDLRAVSAAELVPCEIATRGQQQQHNLRRDDVATDCFTTTTRAQVVVAVVGHISVPGPCKDR